MNSRYTHQTDCIKDFEITLRYHLIFALYNIHLSTVLPIYKCINVILFDI